jgi:hypothetical protein
VPPPSQWAYPRCAGQLAHGKCAERVSLADGYCERTCGICVACRTPDIYDTAGAAAASDIYSP